MKNSNRKIVVKDSSGEVRPNLNGVFNRAFRVACNCVRSTGDAARVTYYGEKYTIEIS